jgi:hypothetical protein
MLGRVLRGGGAWVLYVAASVLLLRPLLVTTIVADDFLNPFVQYHQGGAGIGRAVEYGWDGANAAGHFNYLGQIVGAFYNLGWLGLASTLGIRFSTVYALTKLVTFLVCAEAAARYLTAVAERAGYRVGPWRARLTTAGALFASLQFHGFWSNDPVGSYPLSGYASAALGFAYLRLVVDLDRHRRWWAPAAVGLAGLGTILYYELNAMAVAAAVLPLLWIALRPVTWSDRLREAVRIAPAVAVPFLATVALQLRAAPTSENYGGTSVEVGSGVLETFWIATRSSLPGASWTLTRKVLVGGDQPFRWSALVVVLLLGAAAAALFVRHGFGVERTATPRSSRTLLWLGAAPVAYWLGATLLQSATAKVQTEVTRVGQVYNFYAIGSTALAIVGALVVIALAGRPRGRIVAVVLLGAFAVFSVAQVSTSVALSKQFYDGTEPNRRVLVSFSERRPEAYRCTALRDWTAGAWPEYYEEFMVAGLQAAYERFHDEPFCTGFVRTN